MTTNDPNLTNNPTNPTNLTYNKVRRLEDKLDSYRFFVGCLLFIIILLSVPVFGPSLTPCN